MGGDRQRHPMKIWYTTFATDFGEGLLAATDKGICSLQIVSDAQTLAQNLLFEFPKAGIQRNDDHLAEWATAMQRYLMGEQSELDMPLDVQGTDFQQIVWDAIRTIPYGETRTYSEITALIGKSAQTIRAVGSAVGANPVAFVIPCHRVLREDGGLGGYRWGLELKTHLLKMETANLSYGRQRLNIDQASPRFQS